MFEGLKHLVSLERAPTEILRDLMDILVVAFIIYRTALVLRGTPAMKAGLGVAAFGVLYVIAKYAELATLLSVLSWLASSAILILVVVFQNDIKRALERVGARPWLSSGVAAQERAVDEIVEAAKVLARHRIGALVCIERDADVLEFVQNKGIDLDAEVTSELLISLFIPEALNKTHDGAVLIRNLKIARAGVFFPLPKHTQVEDATLGSRHRAAIGITEETDAVVVIVSEERGTISLCYPNGMSQNVDSDSLKKALLGLVGFDTSEKRGWFARLRAELRRTAERSTSDTAAATSVRPPPMDKAMAVATTGKIPVPQAKSATGKSGRYPQIKKEPRTGRSGRFVVPTATGEESATPGASRVSVPMPSPKDRKTLEPKVEETDPAKRGSRPSVTKPMTPTELPTTTLPDGDS